MKCEADNGKSKYLHALLQFHCLACCIIDTKDGLSIHGKMKYQRNNRIDEKLTMNA